MSFFQALYIAVPPFPVLSTRLSLPLLRRNARNISSQPSNQARHRSGSSLVLRCGRCERTGRTGPADTIGIASSSLSIFSFLGTVRPTLVQCSQFRGCARRISCQSVPFLLRTRSRDDEEDSTISSQIVASRYPGGVPDSILRRPIQVLHYPIVDKDRCHLLSKRLCEETRHLCSHLRGELPLGAGGWKGYVVGAELTYKIGKH